MVSQKNPDNVVTSAAYLLFYRRRSDRPLGPPYLQKIADQFMNPDSDDAAEESGDGKSRNASRSPAGNGLRLGGSSRNGSSSAFGAGAGALQAGSLSAGNLLLNGAAVGTADDDAEMLDQGPPPPYDADEGYAGGDDDDDANFRGVAMNQGGPGFFDEANWNFNNVPDNESDTIHSNVDIYDDANSDAPNDGGEDLQSRMLEDFGDDMLGEGYEGLNPGLSTPFEDDVPPLSDDGEVVDVVLDDEPVAPAMLPPPYEDVRPA
jgi:ubiquitin carboxyl-terminal hydrolase 4/11/15